MKLTLKTKSFSEVIRTEPLVLVDFMTDWCGPCNMMRPILEELKSSLGAAAKILDIDVEKNSRVASRYDISGVPTFLLFKKGREVWRQTGLIPPSQLRQLIEQNGRRQGPARR